MLSENLFAKNDISEAANCHAPPSVGPPQRELIVQDITAVVDAPEGKMLDI